MSVLIAKTHHLANMRCCSSKTGICMMMQKVSSIMMPCIIRSNSCQSQITMWFQAWKVERNPLTEQKARGSSCFCCSPHLVSLPILLTSTGAAQQKIPLTPPSNKQDSKVDNETEMELVNATVRKGHLFKNCHFFLLHWVAVAKDGRWQATPITNHMSISSKRLSIMPFPRK